MLDQAWRPQEPPQPGEAQVTSQMFFGTSHDAVAHAPHRHDEDQLLRFPDGVAHVLIGARRWIIQETAAFWIPAGIVHAIEPHSSGVMHSVYVSARLRPDGERWSTPRAIECSPLMAELIRHASSGGLAPATRGPSHALLSALMQSSADTRSGLAVPTHPAARALAERILADPRDDVSLAAFAREAGVGSRTIMRAFLAEAGCGVARWRARARLTASIPLLADGLPVSIVAERVGYRTTSGFIDAFRSTYGTTPAAHRRAQARRPEHASA